MIFRRMFFLSSTFSANGNLMFTDYYIIALIDLHLFKKFYLRAI